MKWLRALTVYIRRRSRASYILHNSLAGTPLPPTKSSNLFTPPRMLGNLSEAVYYSSATYRHTVMFMLQHNNQECNTDVCHL